MNNIHGDQPLLTMGTPLDHAEQALILLHGRGATARSLQPLVKQIQVPGTAYLMPQASQNRWYPETAFGPLEVNQPDLDAALQRIRDLIREATQVGLEQNQIFLGGFSQGACLAAEYASRNPKRYGGIFVLSGALIGPPELKRKANGSLASTPVLIGCSDQDPWIPGGLVEKTADHLEVLGADVDLRIYPGMGHTINQDEIQAVTKILQEG